MAQPEERVPMEFDDWVGLILLLIVTLAFGAYTVDFFMGFLQMR
jgi:hypothetical protein